MSTPPPSIASTIPSNLKRSEPHAFDLATDIYSQAGKVFLSTSLSSSHPADRTNAHAVTSSTSGIGLQTAIELACHASNQIWLSGRVEKGAVEKVKEAAGVGNGRVDVRFVQMNLADFESVKTAAKMVLDGCKRLDVLMLNAGMVGQLFLPRTLSRRKPRR
jgi:hypothetical protein